MRGQLLPAATGFILVSMLVFGWSMWLLPGPYEDVVIPTTMGARPRPLYSLYAGLKNQLLDPMGIATAPDGRVYVTDTGNQLVQVFGRNGKPERTIGRPGDAPGGLRFPYGIVRLSSGNLWVADSLNERISEFEPGGRFVRVAVDRDNAFGLLRPGAMAPGPGDTVMVSDIRSHAVFVLDEDGNLVRRLGDPGEGPGEFMYPQSVAVDPRGRIWVADAGNSRVQVLDDSGEFLFAFDGSENGGSRFGVLRGLGVDNLGRVLVVDAMASTVRVFDENGGDLWVLAREGTGPGQVLFPIGIHISAAGKILLAEKGNDRVQVWGYGR